MSEVEDRFLNVRDLAQRYSCTTDCLYKRIRRGDFPVGVHIGNHRRWKLSELLQWEAGLVPAQAAEA